MSPFSRATTFISKKKVRDNFSTITRLISSSLCHFIKSEDRFQSNDCILIMVKFNFVSCNWVSCAFSTFSETLMWEIHHWFRCVRLTGDSLKYDANQFIFWTSNKMSLSRETYFETKASSFVWLSANMNVITEVVGRSYIRSNIT